MQIHHLNCGTFCPVGGALMDGRSRGVRGQLVCHCLLIEAGDELVLVDTGIGMQDVAQPFPRLSRFYAALLNVQFKEQDTALAQVRRLGFRAEDVRHIVVTHLDFDHAGGLEDFPQARVHVLAAELQAARKYRTTFVARRRYRPAQWDEVQRWEQYEPAGERWHGFECVRQLRGLPPEILVVPLVGHTSGHCGVAVLAPGGALLHAGDAYFFREEINSARHSCPAGLRAYQKLMEVDRAQRLHNQRRLRELAAHASNVRIFCAHDALEWQELSMSASSMGLTAAV